MSSFLNRLKNLKTGSMNFNFNEGDTGSIDSYEEQGFLCPVCHRKFPDTTGLEHHYLQTHSQSESAANYPNTNGTKNSIKHEETEDSLQEASIWKQQFFVSEEGRMQLSSELMQQRQRVGDLEEELESLQKQLRSTQMKVVHQSQEIGNLKATKDVYDAQLAIFTDELLTTQGELKEKQNQVDTLYNDLIPRPTNDDVDVLKRELVSVQQRMNDMALEKEQQIEPLRDVLSHLYEYTKHLDQFENTFDQNISIYDEIINNHTSQIESDINQMKQFIHSTRERKEKMFITVKHMRNRFNENEIEIEQLKQTNSQLHIDLEHRNQINEQLTNDCQIEQKQTNSYRIQIETLTDDIHELEHNFEELKQEKNQLILTKMDGDQDDERQNLVRQLTQEKDQYEQQIKDLRKQIKQINEEKDNISQQFTQINTEKNQFQDEQIKFNNEINSLKQQLDELNKEKEEQVNKLSEEHNSINMKLENDLQNHKQEIERLENEFQQIKSQLTEQINQLEKENLEYKQSIDTLQSEKLNIEELQTIISQLNTQLNQKNNSLNHLSLGIRRSIDLAHKTSKYIQENIFTSQKNLLTIIEQSEEDFQNIRRQTLEEIREEFTNYLTVIHTVIIDDKIKLEKQTEEDYLKSLQEKQNSENEINQIKNKHQQLIKEYDEQKQKLDEVNKNFFQVSESLSQSNQTENLQREKIALLEDELTNTRSDLESRIKKNEMQLSALTENLSAVRSELKVAHEKLLDFEQIKSEKIDLEKRLNVNQDERQNLLERSITSENRNEKLLLENGQLAKKISDLEFALQELAREYQGLQIQTNKVSERRWLNDNHIHECMKCNQIFTITQRKHHCRSCGNVFCDQCSSKTAIVAASSKKPQRVCDQCFKELTS